MQIPDNLNPKEREKFIIEKERTKDILLLLDEIYPMCKDSYVQLGLTSLATKRNVSVKIAKALVDWKFLNCTGIGRNVSYRWIKKQPPTEADAKLLYHQLYQKKTVNLKTTPLKLKESLIPIKKEKMTTATFSKFDIVQKKLEYERELADNQLAIDKLTKRNLELTSLIESGKQAIEQYDNLANFMGIVKEKTVKAERKKRSSSNVPCTLDEIVNFVNAKTIVTAKELVEHFSNGNPELYKPIVNLALRAKTSGKISSSERGIYTKNEA